MPRQPGSKRKAAPQNLIKSTLGSDEQAASIGAKPIKRVRFEDDIDITVKQSNTATNDPKVVVTREM